ncbi:acetate kinase [Ilumatobacter fluminis]|uniref:Acetate kinase n=1 Tax=Ilumatobacter fluminis TaxID=467091 RepID=A0A4R7HZZ8_9ACTN|nr:acetate kinase [Ilumatobacter fluminis]TDT16832.1 acetate kinase [Ilumatobacter fluminis]
MAVLVLNSGSSSVKYQLIDATDGRRLARGLIEEVVDHEYALADVIEKLGDAPVEAVGHRVVHGGERFVAPTLIDDAVVDAIESLVPLAPLHNPANLAGIRAARRAWPDLPHVAVFDTAFHRTVPAHAYRYAVPSGWFDDYGVRRYGFHGTSYDYVSARAADALGRPRDELDLVVAHLGNGASMAAIDHGRCVETSMGLTPLEGLVMGTRTGDIDPAVIGHVARASGRSEADVSADLVRRSGLVGLCGDSDMRTVTERARSGDADAELALDVFCHRIVKYVGAYVAVLGGCDALVFTAGIGEHSAEVRRRVCERLGAFGVELDVSANEQHEPVITTPASDMTVMVVPTDEEHAIAEQTARVVEGAPS